jgi:hypothetical protein
MLGKMFDRFVAKSPFSVMVRGTLERALGISFAPYAARGRAYSGSSSFSASSGVNRGMGKIPAL